jgi:sarcosine oxidase
MQKEFDTIVLGLGAMGSAATYQLAKAGNRVMGIDQFNPPHGLGSSHGDTRITRLAIGEGEQYTPLVLRSHELWRKIERETGREILVNTGGLIISSGAKTAINHVANFFENTVAAAKKYGIGHELLTADQIRNRFPQFNVKDNEEGYFEKEAGFVRPEEAITAQLELAKKYGAGIHIEEKVLSYDSNAAGVTVKTDKGEYTAGNLIITAGSWLPELIENNLGQYFKVIRQVLYWFDAKDSIEPYLQKNLPIFIWELQGNKQGIYGFPALDESTGVKIATEQYETTTTPETVNRQITEDETRAMFKNFVEPYFPGLSEHCLKSVACLYTVTPDFGFVIDRHPDYDNVIVASPCSGHGFKHSAAIGEVLSELVTKGNSSIDISKFSFDRFKK